MRRSRRCSTVRGWYRAWLALPVVLLLGWSGPVVSEAHASVQGRTLGLGIAVGDPSGVNLKKFLTNDTAFDLHLGFGGSWAWGRRLRLHGDYLWHLPVHYGSDIWLDFYYGIGAKVGLYERRRRADRRREYTGLTLGGRIPLGLSLVIGEAPLDIFLELAPGVRFYDGGGGGFVDGLLGVRFYFP